MSNNNNNTPPRQFQKIDIEKLRRSINKTPTGTLQQRYSQQFPLTPGLSPILNLSNYSEGDESMYPLGVPGTPYTPPPPQPLKVFPQTTLKRKPFARVESESEEEEEEEEEEKIKEKPLIPQINKSKLVSLKKKPMSLAYDESSSSNSSGPSNSSNNSSKSSIPKPSFTKPTAKFSTIVPPWKPFTLPNTPTQTPPPSSNLSLEYSEEEEEEELDKSAEQSIVNDTTNRSIIEESDVTYEQGGNFESESDEEQIDIRPSPPSSPESPVSKPIFKPIAKPPKTTTTTTTTSLSMSYDESSPSSPETPVSKPISKSIAKPTSKPQPKLIAKPTPKLQPKKTTTKTTKTSSLQYDESSDESPPSSPPKSKTISVHSPGKTIAKQLAKQKANQPVTPQPQKSKPTSTSPKKQPAVPTSTSPKKQPSSTSSKTKSTMKAAAKKKPSGIIPTSPKKPRKQKKRIDKDIKELRKRRTLLIPKMAIGRLVRELLTEQSSVVEPYRITAEALIAIHSILEVYLTKLFEDSYLFSVHARRVTIQVKDIIACRRIRGPEETKFAGYIC